MKYTLILMGCVFQRVGFDPKPSLNSAFLVNEALLHCSHLSVCC